MTAAGDGFDGAYLQIREGQETRVVVLPGQQGKLLVGSEPTADVRLSDRASRRGRP